MAEFILLSFFSIFVTSLLSAILSIFSGKKYLHLMIFNLILCFWSFCSMFSMAAPFVEESLFYARLLGVSIVLIPYSFINTVNSLTGYKVQKPYKQMIDVSAVVFAILMISPYMITHVEMSKNGYFSPRGSILIYFYSIYIITLAVFGNIILYKFLYKSTKYNYKYKFIFYGYVIGWIGGNSTLPQFLGFDDFPIIVFLVAIYTTLVSYALVRHRVLDKIATINIMIVKAVALLILVSSYFLSRFVYDKLGIDNPVFESVFMALYLVAIIELYHLLARVISSAGSRLKIANIYDKEAIANNIKGNILGIVKIEDLSKKIRDVVEGQMGVEIAGFYVVKSVLRGGDTDDDIDFARYYGQNIAKENLDEVKRAMRSGGLKMALKYSEASNDIRELMDRISCKGLLPFIFGGKIMGFVILRSRPSKSGYFYYEDMKLFDDLVDNCSIALERIRLHTKILNQREKTLKSLAGSIAHEVRNPLSVLSMISGQISECTDLLSKSSLGKSEFSANRQKISDLTQIAIKSVKRASQIIDMTLSDLKGAKVNKKNFICLDSVKTIKVALNEYGYKDEEERGRVNFEDGRGSNFVFKGDETMFIYIIFNLIKNALYYSKECPKLKIDIYSKPGRYGNIIEVVDSGPGIPKDKLQNLFQDFATSGKKGGTGLGLAFCRRVMESFGGSIRCESKLGKWTKFILEFPAVDESEIIAKSKKSDDEMDLSILKDKEALIVDDEKVALIMLERLLTKNNLRVQKFSKAQDLLAKYQEQDKVNKYIIITDLNMPEMDGSELIRKIREFELKNSIQNPAIIIAHSGNSDEEMSKQLKKDGANDCCVKGRDGDELLGVLVGCSHRCQNLSK